jgi:hypothetical protein
MLMAGVFAWALVAIVGASGVRAEPFSPAEVQYFNDVRAAIQSSQDTPDAAKSEAQLVGDGWMACHDRAIGLVGVGKTGIGPVISVWAFNDLCPNGCANGCLHQ